jgi:SAM-dependent methyltransferase
MIKNIWVIKAVVQKTISFLPYSHKVNYLFQRYITKGVILTDALFEDKLSHLRNHLHYYMLHADGSKAVSLEIGTGWYPIVPLGLYLSGFGKIYSIDISDLLRTDAVHETIARYEQYHQSGRLAAYLPHIDMARFERMKALLAMHSPAHELLATLGIHVIIGDARQIALPDNSIDLINSNNTFEHIYPTILKDILVEFKRVLKPTGVMSHQIDMSDHFAHLDKGITIYNFLTFTDAQWARIDNDIQPQNRLRMIDHHRMYDALGLRVVDQIDRAGDVTQVQALRPRLSPQYQSYTDTDIAISHTLFILKK